MEVWTTGQARPRLVSRPAVATLEHPRTKRGARGDAGVCAVWLNPRCDFEEAPTCF